MLNYSFKGKKIKDRSHFEDFMMTSGTIASNPTPNHCPNKTNRHAHTHRKSTVVFFRMSRTNKLFQKMENDHCLLPYPAQHTTAMSKPLSSHSPELCLNRWTLSGQSHRNKHFSATLLSLCAMANSLVSGSICFDGFSL